MKKLIPIFILCSVISANAANEKLHRFGGFYENSGQKYAVCISVFENFWLSRGVRAFQGYMTYAVNYFNDVPLSPPGFSIAGNETSSGQMILTVFDQNNPSPNDPDLILRPTSNELRGNSLLNLQLIQKGKSFALNLKALEEAESCSLVRPK